MDHISHVILSCYILPGAEGLGEGYIEEINVSVNNRFLFQKANYSQLPKSAFSLSDGNRYNTQGAIRSDQGNEWIYEKVLKYTQAFLFMGHAVWEENSEYRVKLLGANVLSCCLKISTADLRKRGLKMREWRFKELGFSRPGWGHVSHSTSPIPP